MAKKPECGDVDSREPHRLVCAETAQLSQADAAPGSVRRHCAGCGTEIWVAPTGVRLLRDDPRHSPICGACAVTEMEVEAAAGNEIKCDLAPGAREELDAWLRKEAN